MNSQDLVFVRFPLAADDKVAPAVEEATLRLMLVRSTSSGATNSHNTAADTGSGYHAQSRHNHHMHRKRQPANVVTVKAYQLTEPHGRVLLDSVQVPQSDIGERGKWIEFNVQHAVFSWLEEGKANLGFELHCENCEQQGVHVVHDQSRFSGDLLNYYADDADYNEGAKHDDNSPALNVISQTKSARGKRSRLFKPYSQRAQPKKPHHTKCEEHHGQRCCRTEMNVVFKDLKGLDFIIQPKSFDAGYCRGKCPFNYNVASNHAFLQGLLWRQDKKKVTRPCCAPQKLEDLQILHIDEQDPTKLKVSNWSGMRVLECACS